MPHARGLLRQGVPSRGRWWAWLALGALLGSVLAGCGKDDSAADSAPTGPEAGSPDGMPGEPGAGGMPSEPGMGGMPGEPGMGGMSGDPMMGGMPGMGGAAPAAPPAPAVPLTEVKPLFPVRADPFKPIDPPTKPSEDENQTAIVSTTLPIRPNLIVPPEAPAPAPRPQLRNVRMSGFLGGATVKAILEQNKNSMVVTPGAVITIELNGPREFKVVAISQEGVTLRDLRTQDEYFVPMEGG